MPALHDSFLPAHYGTRARVLTAGQGRAMWLAVQVRPAAPLDEIVDHYWFVQGSAPCGPARLSPIPGIELVINLGDSLWVSGERGPAAGHVLKTSWLEGLRDDWMDSTPAGATMLMGVRFRPAGAFRALGRPIQDLTNPVTETELVFGRDLRELRQQLGERANLGARFTALEGFVRRRIAHGPEPDRRVTWAAAHLTEQRYWNNVGALSDALGISHQRFVDIFRKHVGTTPKRLARIARFNQVIRFLATASAPDWPNVALEFGFHDQAHLAREFRAMAGCAPNAYFQRRDGLSGTVMMCD